MHQSVLPLHRLTFVPEGEGVMVGVPGTDSYALFPEDGAALLHRLSSGHSLESGAQWYEQEYGEPVDIEDFVDTITSLGFVRAETDAPDRASEKVSWRRLGAAVFSIPAFVIQAGIVIAAVIAMVRFPEVRPGPHSIFFSDSLLLVQLCLLFAQLPLVLLHESFHALAGRRLNLPSSLGISRRLYFIVFETTLNGLLGVPKKKRYLPFLAGMIADVLVFSTFVLLAAVGRDGTGELSGLGRFALALAFVTVMRIVWQFYLFLRTDLYYVFATALSCVDLHAATRARLLNPLHAVTRRTHRMVDQTQFSERDRAVARWYAPFAAGGAAVLICTTVFAVIPITIRFFSLIFERLTQPEASTGEFWDTLAFLGLSIVQFALVGIVLLRDRRRSRATAGPPSEEDIRVGEPSRLSPHASQRQEIA